MTTPEPDQPEAVRSDMLQALRSILLSGLTAHDVLPCAGDPGLHLLARHVFFAARAAMLDVIMSSDSLDTAASRLSRCTGWDYGECLNVVEEFTPSPGEQSDLDKSGCAWPKRDPMRLDSAEVIEDALQIVNNHDGDDDDR